MSFTHDGTILNISFNGIAVLALAALLMLFGFFLKNRISFLRRYCIPTPVASGMLFALLVLVLKKAGVASIVLDTSYQSPFMLAFFATVGLDADLRILRRGGKDLIKYLLLGVIIATWQNILAVGGAYLTGIHPMYGVLMGAATQVGGHGGGAAFGSQLEAMGFAGSTAVGMASATFGVIAGSLLGGPLARKLINRDHLSSTETVGTLPALDVENSADRNEDKSPLLEMQEPAHPKEFSLLNTFQILLAVFASVMFGSMLCSWITDHLFTFPSTVGAMLFGTLFRNFNDRFHWISLDRTFVANFSDTVLNIFLTISIMSMALEQLASMALPMLLILSLQAITLGLFAYFVVYRAMGRDYDAAVMCGGLMGHGLGATPNAVANIGVLAETYGPSTKALMICSITGAFALDLYQLPMDAFVISLLEKFL